MGLERNVTTNFREGPAFINFRCLFYDAFNLADIDISIKQRQSRILCT